MKPILSAFILGLTAQKVLSAFRPDIQGGVDVAELEPDQVVGEDSTEINMKLYPGEDFVALFKCNSGSKKLTTSADGRFVGCCLPTQHLSGSEQSQFQCCGRGHDLAGNDEVGYICCPTGYSYDGNYCKCYTFKFENGHLLGWNSNNYYGPGPESRNQRSGLFQLCKDEACAPGIPVDPADGIRIKDLHGLPNTGANAGQWLNNARDGAHITKTPNYSEAGVFTLTKWPCGKYCLGGLDSGVGPTCPADVVGSTFTTLDKQSCVQMELMEAPCDKNAKENNCIWKNGDQCCNKVDCCGK
ncbi:MAG: hypothetical protein Q9163_005989, partial [Psora crenata]